MKAVINLILVALSLVGLAGLTIPVVSAAQIPMLSDPGPRLANRFGAVPPPGVHPRVLIGPEELVRLRQLIHTTQTGAYVVAEVESFLDAQHNPGKDFKLVIDGLVNSDRTH